MSMPNVKRGDRPPWSWQGASALVLAVSIGGGWLAGVILASLEAGNSTGLPGELYSLLNGIGQVIAGALGTFLGFSAGTTAGQNSVASTPPPEPVAVYPPPKAARPPEDS